MKLCFNKASPYVRKVLVTAHEKGLADKIELLPIDPWTDPKELHGVSPVGRLPALVLGDGRVMTESALICAYLNETGQGPDLAGDDRVGTYARAGLAQGIIDASYYVVIEGRRPADKKWAGLVTRQMNVIERTVAELKVSGGFDMGDIWTACALGYLSFRLPDQPWRKARPDLAAWFDTVSARKSMQATRPDA